MKQNLVKNSALINFHKIEVDFWSEFIRKQISAKTEVIGEFNAINILYLEKHSKEELKYNDSNNTTKNNNNTSNNNSTNSNNKKNIPKDKSPSRFIMKFHSKLNNNEDHKREKEGRLKSLSDKHKYYFDDYLNHQINLHEFDYEINKRQYIKNDSNENMNINMSMANKYNEYTSRKLENNNFIELNNKGIKFHSENIKNGTETEISSKVNSNNNNIKPENKSNQSRSFSKKLIAMKSQYTINKNSNENNKNNLIFNQVIFIINS